MQVRKEQRKRMTLRVVRKVPVQLGRVYKMKTVEREEA